MMEGDIDKKIEELERRIDELEKEIREMKRIMVASLIASGVLMAEKFEIKKEELSK
jgi:hypothetical protein